MKRSLSKQTPPSRPIRIAVVSDAVHPWHTGGKETRYEQLLKRLPSFGFEVTVYTMKWWSVKPPTDHLKYRALSPKYRMYTGDRRSMLQSILFAISCLRMLVIGRFDVIEADHMPYLQLYPLRVVAWIRRVPLVVTWHEVWGTSYWDQYLGGFAGRIAALIERTATKIPDRIVAVSSGTAEQLIKMGVPTSKVSILWAGVSVDELDLVQPAANSPDIICAGRLIAHKRVDLVLEAVALLRDEGKDRTLAVTGSGPEKERLIAQSHTLGINDLVTFHGELPESEQVWSLMKGARVCAAPSEREGFGLAVAESLAAGTPVVVVDHPSNASRHLVDDQVTGSVITPGDVHQLAASIEYWMEHTHEHHSQGVRFEERHPHLSWDGLTERYAELIREVT